MYTAEIHLRTPTDLKKVFEPEEKDINQRAKYHLTKDKDRYTFHIEARDATALKTVVSSIAKILMVHEKTIAILEKHK